ncbi:hypothetical protein [Anaerocolumna xylanovorans]|uniref:Prenyltransferase and squalene oxidase repeat-containing protein n=1 Tax=Anaerocolumna xylanovorans DSM 12503 TaxID=1121345 RepID=A0A1M7XZD8_9FIRM|nr:hypothetical protein [Anaerocolumna xylanovorans]SHO44432.1 hypothetical protein SAMN02745217_00593 [Anaerocolumna xylanovorans DSM 12503]
MKKLGLEAFCEIKNWMYRNARPVDLALWKYYFENGNKEAVLSSLAYYQNEDGGFGHALEADSWNPNSSPYTTLYAINILQAMDFKDISHPIMQGIFRFLSSGKHFSKTGWLFSIPTNNEYAHAPWWTYNSDANELESIGVTAELSGFVLKYFDKDTDLYKRVILIMNDIIAKLEIQDSYGDMGIGGYCVLLDTIKQAGIEKQFNYTKLRDVVKGLVYNSIERDTSKWSSYGVRPSNYITTPDSIYYKDNEDIVQKELDYLIETREKCNVWNITWSWFENNEKYPKEFAISENWWKAGKAIEKLVLLRNFERIDCNGEYIF